MGTGKSTMTAPEWESLIRKVFIDTWNARTAVDITDYLYRIEDHFFLQKIADQLVVNVANEDRYRLRLKSLAAFFCDALLEYSDDGKQITAHHILQAKHKLADAADCEDIEI
jgi:hypothetical protein